MRSTSFFLLALALGAFAVSFPGTATPAAAQAPASSLKVTIRYAGAGQVDANRKVFIYLFDSPDFMANPGASMPVGTSAVERNGDVATFLAVGAPQVWIAVIYDQTGGFDGNGPPPSGSSAGVYMENGQPAPIATGPTASATVTFDDSFRVPVSHR